MSNWINFSQYEGYAILDDASKMRTPDGVEHTLTPNKLFYFINPNTGQKNFAKPDVLLARAMKSSKPREKKEKQVKKVVPKPKTAPVTSDPVESRNGPKRVKISLEGRAAVVKAAETGCRLFYNTKRWGWQLSVQDPVYILSVIDSPDPVWLALNWGIE